MRKRLIVFSTALVLLLAMAASSSQAQFGMGGPRQSPAAKAECKFPDGKTVHVDYSSPRMRGRKIFGELVPYGEVWRTGANAATSFLVDTDVMVGGTRVPAGSYTLFILPKESGWTLIISKATGEWGIPYPGESQDLARVPMNVSKLPAPVEEFTIAFDHAGGGCTMRFDWETTRASVEITEKK